MRHTRFAVPVALAAIFAAPSLAQPPVPFDDAAVRAVQFIDQQEGWAVGDDGVVWHSINGGKSWDRQKTGTRASLRGVHFLTPYTGWAVGRVESAGGGASAGVMLRTADGGVTWEEVGVNVLPGLHAVRFFDEKNGFVCGDGSPAFPSGLFTTADGGRTWKPVTGGKLPSCRAAEFFPGTRTGVVAGAWGRLGSVHDGEYREGDMDPLAGRTLNAVCTANTQQKGYPAAYAAGDGGAVLRSLDGGNSWGFVDLGLPPAALAACDFRAAAAFGAHVWVAGKPGGFVLHSADAGKTWEVQKLEVPVPVNGMYFLTDQIGWMTAELGCIFATTDGGKSWQLGHSGGRRAAVLCLHASHASTPLDVISALGLGEGYLCAAVGLTGADPATADPRRAGDAARLSHAMRLAGGAAGEVSWAFPVAAHAAGLPPRDLMATWDRMHGGKAAEQMLRQAVAAIRTWQPEVIVADVMTDSGTAADALALNAAKEAFKQAADPNAFPEQIQTLGLRPWAAKKLYAATAGAKGVPVLIDQSVYSTALADSPKDFAEPATRVLAGDAAVTDRRAYALVAHRLEGAEKHSSLMEGIVLGRGGAARRAEVKVTLDVAAMEEKKKAAQSRRRLEAMAAADDAELAGADKVIGILDSELKRMPDDIAARTAHAVAGRMARDGKWVEAREVYGLLSAKYPGHPLAIDAYRWLTAYHASTEARRRTEIRQKIMLRNVALAGEGTGLQGAVVPASGTVSNAAKPAVAEDVYHLYSPEAVLKWHQACLDLEPRLVAFGPLHSRDPASWLCFLAARRHVGRHNDAVEFVREYFKTTPGAAAMAPGADPWRDCLAAELWMTDRGAFAAPPKPFGVSRHTDVRPLLDGKLDDECWKDLTPMPLKANSAGGDAKAFGGEFKTEARFAYDDKYLYVAVSCAHPAGLRVEPVAKRTRDADMAGRDRVDILLDMDRDYQTYYRLQIDHRGCLAEDCWGYKNWNPKYFAAFDSTESGWTAELAIPLVELTNDRPAHGRVWAANVSRVVPGKGMLTWSGPAADAPRPEGMGLLQFRAEQR
ncbi:MAG TPA: YCF48-related protein [Gemmata sp.]|nr:YCF48-related protein [Gemmata sp.]